MTFIFIIYTISVLPDAVLYLSVFPVPRLQCVFIGMYIAFRFISDCIV